MEIKRSGSQPSTRGPVETFTGAVRIDPCSTLPGRREASALTSRSSRGPEALAGFKSGKYRILVATDVAAPGIVRRGPFRCGQLRCAERAGRLHSPRRPYGAR